MKIDIVGQPYALEDLILDAQTCINFYEVLDDTGKTPKALHSTPGKGLFSAGDANAKVRGIVEHQGLVYTVIDNIFYRVASDGTKTSLGTLATLEGRVKFATNDTQVCADDATNLYVYTPSNDSYTTQSVDGNFLGSTGYIVYQDSFGLVAIPNENLIQASNSNDFTSWGATFVASNNKWGEYITTVAKLKTELWVFGNRGAEVFYNAGSAGFTFAPRTDIVIMQGIVGQYAWIAEDNTIFWVTLNEHGQGFIVRNEYPYIPKTISTEAVSNALNSYPTLSDCYTWSYTDRGHLFICFVFPSGNTTWCYDATTKMWHERKAPKKPYNQATFDNLGQEWTNCYCFGYGKHLVGDYQSGNIYYLDKDLYTDNGTPIFRERTAAHMSEEERLISASNFTLIAETGMANADVPNPQIELLISKDRGYSFTSRGTRSAGLIGQHRKRIRWTQLGQARDWVIRLRMTEAVRWSILGAYVNAEVGDS